MNLMKTIKTFLILFLLGTVSAMAQNAKGQFSVKPMAGVSVSTFSGSATGDVYHSIARPTGGLELEFGATEWLGVSLGISYSQLGAKVDGELWGGMVNGDGANFYTAPMKVSSGIYSVVMRMDGHVYGDYLSFPLVANIYIPQVKGLSVKAGVQLGVLVKDELDAALDGVVISQDNYHMTYPFSLTTKQTDILKSVDFGIPVGLSYEYKNVVLDARYYFGLSKIDNTVDADNVHNHYFSVTLGYWLHL